MEAPLFLETLGNVATVDYMHSHKERAPSFFLKRAARLMHTVPGLNDFISGTRIIHITGTSGKGTVGAILQSILSHAGFRAGFYNSPHTIEVYERIRFMKKNASGNTFLETVAPKTFAELTQKIKPHLEAEILNSPFGLSSYFEVLLILAFQYFQKKQAKWIVLEVGCGGRYDATNIIQSSHLSIITSIGKDHLHLIGPTLKDVAREKAGIIKKNGQVLIGSTINGALKHIIQLEAQKKHSKFFQAPSAQTTQDENENIARSAAELLLIPENAIKNGIKNYTPLPGRFSTLAHQPLIIADGAHNPEKIAYLIRKLGGLPLSRFKKRTLIFAASENKDWRKMLQPLLPLFDKIYLTRHTVLQRKVADLKKLYQFSRLRRKSIRVCIDPRDAFKEARAQSGKNDFILATGSLFLAGDIMRACSKNDHGLKKI